ncbi:MAG: RNA pseudouridine synthase [Planctomycetales bacterium]|nr:RNA pseudouridine synthase [Planctomycetales bacterium]
MPARPPISVLYEDNHLLIVNKPAGLPTMGVAEDRESVLTLAKQYIRRKYNKPGNVYLGTVSRLDSLATGALVFARTSKAAARLTKQFLHCETEKRYWAIVAPTPDPPEDDCVNWVAKDERHHRMQVVKSGATDAKEARLHYRTLRRLPRGTLIEIHLETGRKHQIRLQMAHRGWPVVGDTKYGSSQAFPSGIALHARHLTIEHPTLKTPVTVVAPVPVAWQQWGVTEQG